MRPAVILTPRRIIRLTREPAPPATAPPADIPVKDLNDATGPERMAQLVVPGTGVEHGGGDALALEPGGVDVLLELEPNLLHDVDFDLVAPGDAPGAAVLRGVLSAGGAGAGAGAVDRVLFHRCPGLGLVFVCDVELCRSLVVGYIFMMFCVAGLGSERDPTMSVQHLTPLA